MWARLRCTFFLCASTWALGAGAIAGQPTSAPLTGSVRTEVRSVDGVPVLFADGEPFVLKVWTAGLHLGNQTNDEVKAKMDWAAANGFNAVEITAEWPSIEPLHDAHDWSRIDDLMDYAAAHGLYVLLFIDATRAPSWFGDELHPGAVFETYVADPEAHPDMTMGRLAVEGWISIPNFYHPDYWLEADEFFTAAIGRFKTHPALFGYDLGLFTSGEYNYPGGTAYGIAGFSDYSDYTRGLYGDPPLPFVEFSQPGPDTRPEWLDWMRYRIDKKREALDHFGALIKDLDPDHVLIAWTGDSPLWGGWDSGFIAEASGADYPYLLTNPYLDIIRGAPQVTPNLFEVIDGDLSAVPYLLLASIRAVRNHGKLFLLQTERAVNSEAENVTSKIAPWVDAFHALGAQFVWWEEPEGNRDYAGEWTPAEKTEVVSTLELGDRPRAGRATGADFVFVDLPFETAKFYADESYNLMFAAEQIQAFLDAGLPYATLSEEEILADRTLLDRYKAVGFFLPLAYDLLAPPELKAIIADFEADGGTIWRGDPLNGFLYAGSGYADTSYLDSLRTFYDVHGLARHRYSGYGLQVWGDSPYVFVLSRSGDFSGVLEVSIPGWGLPEGPAEFVEINSGRHEQPEVVGDTMKLEITVVEGQPYLFMLDGDLCHIEDLALTKDESRNTVHLEWGDVAGFETYPVKRALGPRPEDFDEGSSTTVPVSEYDDVGALDDGVSYFYLVRKACPQP